MAIIDDHDKRKSTCRIVDKEGRQDDQNDEDMEVNYGFIIQVPP